MNFLSLSLFLPLLLLSSCADKPTAPPAPKPKQEQAQLVGQIASIHKSENFVLIQSYGKWTTPTGAILATNGSNNRAANLKVTGEHIGQYAAADIQSGTLEIGDSVYTTLKYEEIDTQEEPEKTPETGTHDSSRASLPPPSGTHDSSPSF